MSDVSVLAPLAEGRHAAISARFASIGTAQLADAATETIEVLDLPLRRHTAATHICGPLFPVQTSNDMLPCLQALAAAPVGWVLFIANEVHPSEGLVGDIFCLAAETQGLAGVVVDGAARDLGELASIGLPVFSTEVNYVSARTTTQRLDTVPATIRVGGATLSPGIWLFGDRDGFLTVPASEVDAILIAGEVLRERELRLKRELEAGRRLDEVTGLADFLSGITPSLRYAP